MKGLLLLAVLTSCDYLHSKLSQEKLSHEEELGLTKVLAEIDSEKITVKEFKEHIGVSNLSFEAKSIILDELISNIVIRQLAQSAHISILEEDIDKKILNQYSEQSNLEKIREQYSSKWEELRKNIKLRMMIDRLKEKLPKTEDAYIEKVYQGILKSNPKICLGSDKVRMSHILVQNKEKSNEIKLILDSSPGKFEEIARLESLAPEASKGGDLGYFERTELIPVFDIYFEQNIGFISPPIPSEYGIHFVKITGKLKGNNQADKPCLNVVRLQIKQDILDKEWLEWLDGEVKRRKIAKNTVLLKAL